VRPKNFFFISIDGVAPYAKVNYQRGRKYLTAQEYYSNLEKETKAHSREVLNSWILDIFFKTS
jgi:5'-3' exonuclease